MKKAVATAIAFGALAPAAQAAVLEGGPGDQSNPHISGSLVQYDNEINGTSEVRWRDFDTGAGGAIPMGNSWFDFLGDVHEDVITFTRIRSHVDETIMRYDVATGALTEVAPGYPRPRRAAALGDGLIAWQEAGDPNVGATFEVVAHDPATGTTTPLTSDGVLDRAPAAAPDGDTIVWPRCPDPSSCDIHTAVRTATGWDVHALSATAANELSPDTDGEWTVYLSIAGQASSIHAQPDGGGPVRVLDLPGQERNPRIDKGVVLFHLTNEATFQTDVHAWDLVTGEVRRLTDSPEHKSLGALSVTPGGLVRAVWTASDLSGASMHDLHGLSFQRPAPPAAHSATVQQPIDADGSSTFNAKRGVVPVRFVLDGTCDLPPATIRVTRIGGAGEQAVDESVYASKADAGSAFRVVDCAYQYNVATSALGAGRYRVQVLIEGVAVGAAEFTLR